METGLRCVNNLKVVIDAVKSQKSVNYTSSLAQKYVVFLFQNLPTNSREMPRMAENGREWPRMAENGREWPRLAPFSGMTVGVWTLQVVSSLWPFAWN